MAIQQRAVALALALAAGLVTSGLLYVTVSQQAEPGLERNETMVVARRPIQEWKPIASEDLMLVEVDRRPAGAFADVGELAGRQVLVPVAEGEPLLSGLLASPEAQPGLWQRIPPGMRAVTVPVNEVASVAGFVRPGVRVDVIVVKRDDETWKSAVLAQDVPVLAVSQDDSAQPAKAKLATSATLLASLAQSLAISRACESGKVRLVMRGPRDRAVEAVKPPERPAEVRKLKATAASPTRPAPSAQPVAPPAAQQAVQPVKAEPRGPLVEVIRGGDVEVQRL